MCIVSEREKSDQQWKEVARTLPVKNDLNPDFGPVDMKFWFERRQQLRFEIFDTDKNSPTKAMGHIETTMNKIMGSKHQILEVKLTDGHEAGIILRAVATEEYKQTEPSAPKVVTFIDYLRSGWQLNMAVAIDYTASNGDQNDADSLHHMGPSNQYEASINMVGAIMEPYDYDKMYPVYGFGGKPGFMGLTTVNHCFPLSG